MQSGEEASTQTERSGEFPLLQLTPYSGEERYLIEEEIARGGQATILKAHDRKLCRPVAIKQLRSHCPAAEVRFVNEALITARLAHPSIVPIYDVGHWADGTPYFAMKLVQGDTLKDRILRARGRQARSHVVDLLVRVIEAVAYAHREGVVHRDLKPSNILVSDFDETMVIDWGIAELLYEPPAHQVPIAVGSSITSKATVLGTPGFMAPEQAHGENTDERTDVYALGAILFIVLAGSSPYTGLSSSQIVDHVRNRIPIERLAMRAPQVAPALCRVVDRALAQDPVQRYRDADELLHALRRALSVPRVCSLS